MSTATEVRGPEIKKPVEVRRIPVAPSLPPPVEARPLFSDCLLESQREKNPTRTVATVISFIVQCSLLVIAILVPLMYTDVLPKQQLLSFLVAPPPPPPPPPPAAAPAKPVARITEISDGHLRTPSRIPQKVQILHEEDTPPTLATGGVVGGVPGGIPGGQLGGVIGGIISSTSNLAIVPKMAAPVMPKRIRISQGVTEGRIIQRIQPEYPPLARAARVQGDVILTAIISRTGEIQNLVLVSGHPMLVPAALKAVQQWRYRPFLLNGEPVEVETTIKVIFQLS
jgi:protein TonB